MISLTIDSSVFALQPFNRDDTIEHNNLVKFLSKLDALHSLENCPSISVSYMNKIPDYLISNSLDPYNLNMRVLKFIDKIKQFPFGELNVEALVAFCDSMLSKFDGKGIHGFIKGKIGIHENIPEHDKDPGIEYRRIDYDRAIYPIVFHDKLTPLFDSYLGYFAKLNYKYDSFASNYLVTSGKTPQGPLEVTMKFDGDKKSQVNIINIESAKRLCADNIYEKTEDAYDELKNTHSKNIIYGCGIKIENMKKGMGFDGNSDLDIKKRRNVSESDFSTKLFFYVKTLNDVADIAVSKNMGLIVKQEKLLIEFINSHGCICSGESKCYLSCKIVPNPRFLLDDKGNYKFFRLHLKPITYDIKNVLNDLSRRIYLKWIDAEKKFLIGHIGEHFPICTNDPKSICVLKNCKYRPKTS